jgi:type IV pilus assembly protein PilQ
MKKVTVVSGLLRRASAFLFVGLLSGFALAQNTLLGMNAYVADGVEFLRLDFAQDVKQLPRGFALQSPPRITLDFPDVASQSQQKKWTFGLTKLDSTQIFVAPERTRVVMHLKQNTGYLGTAEGKSVLIRLQADANDAQPAPTTANPASDSAATPSTPAGSASAVTARAKLPAPATQGAVQDIDFKRGAQGAGLVILALPSEQTIAEVRQLGKGLTVELDKVRLPEQLRRRMDVGDFATPVQTITSTQAGDRVRIRIEPNGKWEFNTVQIGNMLTIAVMPVSDKSTLNANVANADVFTGQKLSLNFQSIDVRSVLQVIADFTKFNIVTSDTVTGTVTLRLEDVPWDQALNIILQSKGLDMRKKGNVIWVAPKEEIAGREKLDFESQAVAQNMEPLRTQSFQINYAKAVDIVGKLKEDVTAAVTAGAAGAAATTAPVAASKGQVLSGRGTLFADARTNQIFVTDTAASLERVQQFIAKVDVPLRQVLIEARLVVASEDFGRSLGVKLGGFDAAGGSKLGGGVNMGYGTSLNNAFITSGIATNATTGSTLINPQYVNFPASSSTGASVPSIAFTLFGAASGQLIGLELSALESNATGKVVSSPRVLTMDQQPAIVSQGTQIPYATVSSNGTQTQFQQANLKLEVTPQITPDGTLVLTLDISKDSLGIATTAGYAIDTKRVKTQALVENGGTVVIGGIYEMTENNTENKVPFFGDLPWVGVLFKNNAKTTTKKELLVFITPKIVVDKNFVAQ